MHCIAFSGLPATTKPAPDVSMMALTHGTSPMLSTPSKNDVDKFIPEAHGDGLFAPLQTLSESE